MAFGLLSLTLAWMGHGPNDQSQATDGDAPPPSVAVVPALHSELSVDWGSRVTLTSQQDSDPEALKKTKAELNQLFEEWRGIMIEGNTAFEGFHNGDRESSVKHRKEWESAYDRGVIKKLVICEKINELIAMSPAMDEESTELAKLLLSEDYKNGRYTRVYSIAKRLTEKFPENEGVLQAYGLALIASNRFEEAESFKNQNGSLINEMPATFKGLYSELDSLNALFAKEQEYREQEAASDDLPRVMLRTSNGAIVVELFENQVPNTVANFISLVEKRFYNNTVFHRVLNEFMAQGGDPSATGQGGPGYTIADEYTNNDRMHWTYVLSMANASTPNSAGSQFFITLVPTPHLNSKHVVFGRVIDGFDVVDSLTRTHQYDDQGTETPIKDAKLVQILEATVVRKRDHEYKPKVFVPLELESEHEHKH